MALSAEQMKEWVQELHFRIRELEEEVKTLKFKNEQLTQKLEVGDNILNRNGVNVRDHQEVNSHTMEKDFQICQEIAPNIIPFEVEAIVDLLMSYVDPNDLPNCRLVCKLEERAQSFPMFQNLKLDLDYRSWKGSEPYGYHLMSSYGRTLQKLQLNFFVGEEEKETWKAHALLRRDFFDALEDISDLEIKMSCILKIAPNLETLYWRTEQMQGSRDFIQSFLLVNPPKLEHLYLHTRLETDQVSIQNHNSNSKNFISMGAVQTTSEFIWSQDQMESVRSHPNSLSIQIQYEIIPE